MITLLASLAGFITSIIPEILKIFKDFNDKKYQLNMLDKQIEYGKLSDTKPFKKISNTPYSTNTAHLCHNYKSGIGWVDGLNGSVRPVLAYSFFLMYAMVKCAQYITIARNESLSGYFDTIWSVDDQAIFASIISFYFGHRAFNKVWKNKL